MYCCYLSYFNRFLFFTVCLLYVNVRRHMYVMFLLRQRRLNKLIIIIIRDLEACNVLEAYERVMQGLVNEMPRENRCVRRDIDNENTETGESCDRRRRTRNRRRWITQLSRYVRMADCDYKP